MNLLPPSNDSAPSSPRGSSSRVSSPAERQWSPAPSGNSFRGEGKGKPCRFWVKGTCRNGNECTWKHVPDCNFFKKGAGSCTKGKACSFRHHDPSKAGAPSSPGSPRDNDSHSRGRSPTPKLSTVCLKSAFVQSSPLHDSLDDGVKGALSVAERKIRFHDMVVAQTLEYDPSEHWSFKDMKPVRRLKRKFARVVPHSEADKLFKADVSSQSSQRARQNAKKLSKMLRVGSRVGAVPTAAKPRNCIIARRW